MSAPALAAEGASSYPPAILAGIRRWLADPVCFMREVFEIEPDAWQVEALRAYERGAPPRVALKACKGPGKTCVEGVAGWWSTGLHPYSNGIAVGITEDNLRDNLWKELASLLARPKAAWLRTQFAMTGERIYAKEAERTWWLNARAFAQDADETAQANTLAGLHSSFVFVLLDEVSDMPQGVVSAAEGIFTTVNTWARMMMAGNATRADGPLFDACTRQRARYHVIEITGDPDDPRRSPRIDIEYAREQIRLYTRDDPVVMVNILGLFPRMSPDHLLGPDDIMRAEGRDVPAKAMENEAIVYGLDVARFGLDSSKLRRRQGAVLFRPHTFRDCDGPTLASRVAYVIDQQAQKDRRGPDAIFVDVGGVGASAFDHLKLLAFGPVVFPVDFGGAPDDQRYADKSAEMHFRLAKWVRSYGCLPSGSNELGAQLTQRKYSYRVRDRRTVICLESKDELRKRGIQSPDDADASALTFASETVVRRDRNPLLEALAITGPGQRAVTEYDPYAS